MFGRGFKSLQLHRFHPIKIGNAGQVAMYKQALPLFYGSSRNVGAYSAIPIHIKLSSQSKNSVIF